MTNLIPIPSKPNWPGPVEGGITQSIVTKALACPFRFFLYAYCGLEEVKAQDVRLMWGDTLHKGLEHLIQGDSFENSATTMKLYREKNYPMAPRTYDATTKRMLHLYGETALPVLREYGTLSTEVPLLKEYEFTHHCPVDMDAVYNLIKKYELPDDLLSKFIQSKGNYELVDKIYDVTLLGKCDVTNQDRTFLCDHKGKGTMWSGPETVREELGQDFQMNFYSWILGAEKWIYDLILIPEESYRVPSIRVGEHPEEYADRLFYTHKDFINGFPIQTCWGRWINQVPHFQPKERNLQYVVETILPIIVKICNWWNFVNSTNFDPNDPKWWNELFYKHPIRVFDASRTPKFKCEYHSILIDKDNYDSLRPVKAYYPELSHVEG